MRPPPSSTRTDTPVPYTTLFRSVILYDVAKTGQQLGFQRKAGEQGLAKAVDRLDADRAAGAVDHRREQRSRALHQPWPVPFQPQRQQIEPDRKRTRLNSSH